MDLRRSTLGSIDEMSSTLMKRKSRREPSPVWQEMKAMFAIVVPVTVTTTARLVIYNIDIAYLGHLGKNELAGAALATVVVNLVTVTLFFGFFFFCNQYPCTKVKKKQKQKQNTNKKKENNTHKIKNNT